MLRALLAFRSSVFRSMLFGSFVAESERGSTVRVPYVGRVMKAVVEYSITDQVEALVSVDDKKDAREQDNRSLRLDESDVAVLAEAAHYFDVPGLQTMAETWAYWQMEKRPQTACTFLEVSPTTRGSFEMTRNGRSFLTQKLHFWQKTLLRFSGLLIWNLF